MPFDKALEGAQKAFCSTKVKCAAPARASSYKKAFTTNSSAPGGRVQKIKVGLPWEDDTQMGSQVNAGQLETVLKYVKSVSRKAAASSAAKKIEGELSKGEFVEPI